jgi:uncharacterized membrane protein YkoI
MKINRWIALAVIALLAAGALGAAGARALAQSGPTATPTAAGPGCEDDKAESQSAGPDTDTADEQCGDQNEADQETASGPDADKVEDQGGDQRAAAAETEAGDKETDGQEAAPAATPAISAERAQKTAEAYLKAGPATQPVELDDEDGQLVYSVTFGSTDVKVDATTGAVLKVETDQD